LFGRFLALLAVPFLTAATFAPAPAPPWRYDRTVDGLRVELRGVSGSKFDEIRVTGVSTESLDRLCDAVFAKGLDGTKAEGRFKRRDVLRETATERWTYEQISVPIVSDRDYVMHVKLDQPAASGACRISFETESDAARPPVHGLVRIPCIRGSWTLTPGPGVVNVSYQVFSDPGGGVPAFLVRGPQQSAAIDFFKTILGRAKARR
jgi:hypothetical protein